ncbi:MAG: spore photoproduct lyase family protein, partial [Cellulosilyticaceae bacterium]
MLKPDRIIFEKKALAYPLGNALQSCFATNEKIEKYYLSTNKIKSAIPGESLSEQYNNGKKTMVVGVKKASTFQSCKPSAHYQLPLVSGCMGKCQYCYLNTRLGDKPYIRVNVNVD